VFDGILKHLIVVLNTTRRDGDGQSDDLLLEVSRELLPSEGGVGCSSQEFTMLKRINAIIDSHHVLLHGLLAGRRLVGLGCRFDSAAGDRRQGFALAVVHNGRVVGHVVVGEAEILLGG
jgi:hypothetical protein